MGADSGAAPEVWRGAAEVQNPKPPLFGRAELKCAPVLLSPSSTLYSTDCERDSSPMYPCKYCFFFCKYRQVVVSFAVNTAFIQWICLCELPTECAGNTVPPVTPLPWDTIAFWQKNPGGEQSQRCRGVASSPGKG